MHRPLRLTIDSSALQANWRWLQDRAGVPAGAAIKADGYGLGARETMRALHEAGCREFFVSTWAEAEELGSVPGDSSLVVLHGVGPDDIDAALAIKARPVLNTVEQVARWKEIAPGRECDVMIDTGMNRLGLRPDEIGGLAALKIHTLHSHLACADEDHPHNQMQLERFRAVGGGDSGQALQPRQFRRDLPRPRLQLRPRSPGPRALRRRSSARGGRQYPPGGSGRSADRPAPHDPRGRDLRLWRDVHRCEGHRGRDPQHRLCRRLSARLLLARVARSPANMRCLCSAACRWT